MSGYMIEKRINAKDNDALNRSAVCATDVDGGTLVSMSSYANGVFTVAKSTSGSGLYMAYNPSEHFTKIGTKLFAGLSEDPRDYTNLATRTLDVFELKVHDMVGLTDGNIASGDITSVTVNSYLEQDSTGFRVKSTPTASTTSLKVLAIGVQPFPQAGIGMEFAKLYICEVVQN